MKRALVLLALLVIVAVIRVLTREGPEVLPEAAPLTVRLQETPRTPEPAIAQVEAHDAGAPLGIVTITVERNHQPLPGPRVVLRDAQGVEVSGTTDVMGRVTFELALGPWLVMGPEGLQGQHVEVTAGRSEILLALPSPRRVEGTVLDEQGMPAAGVPINQLSFPLAGEADQVELSEASRVVLAEGVVDRELARSDPEGRFGFETTEDTLTISAARGEARASLVLSPPATGVTLRLEELAWLTVLAPSRTTMVTLYFGQRSVARQVSGSAQLRVPVGELRARALSVHRGRLLRASQQLVVNGGAKNVLELEFNEASPVSGVVVDAHGQPLAGVNVGLTLSPAKEPRTQERAVTDSRGTFSLVPRVIRGGDPLYEVHLLSPWKEKGVVRVRLGDAPVRVEAE